MNSKTLEKVYKKQEESLSEKQSVSGQEDTNIHQIDYQTHKNRVTKTQSGQTQKTSKPIKKNEQETSQKINIVKEIHQIKKDEEDQKHQLTVRSKNEKKYEENFKKKQENQSQEIKNYTSIKMKKVDTQIPKYHKKTLKYSQQQKKLQENANQLIEWLDNAYEDDVQLYYKNKTADKKLRCILEASTKLKDVELAKMFIKMDGILLFIKWLLPNEDTQQQTSLTVKIKVLELILDLKLTKQGIEEVQSLQKVIRKYKKSRFQSLSILSSQILDKWKMLKIGANTK